ncbi:hypothetical protein GJ496_008243 [Pomphorhynchus laevis]|nr:hypothetical protein GJ496_008243 [Pomphorhynchus laevis]
MCGFYDTRAIHEFIAKVDKLDQLIDCLSTDLRSANLTSIIWNSSYTDIDDNSKSNNVDKQATVNVGNCDVGNQCITQKGNHAAEIILSKAQHKKLQLKKLKLELEVNDILDVYSAHRAIMGK